MRKSRPCHPQSQGKVERSHRSLRKKITYDLLKQKQSGVNWSKNLQKNAKCLINDKREELHWRSAFEVYFGGKSNELLQRGKSIEKDREPVVQPYSHPPIQIISDNKQKTLRAREAEKKRNKKVSNRTVKYLRQRNKCSQYLVGERVLLRLGKKRKQSIKEVLCCSW